MDGRDIGTTVFPNAELKIFVCASPEERARRRLKEMQEKGENVSYDEVYNNVVERDRIDTTREVSPLRKAADAIELDNGDMTREQQMDRLLSHFDEALKRTAHDSRNRQQFRILLRSCHCHKKAEEELDNSGQLYCLGDIVHNAGEVERLCGKGLQTITHDDLSRLKDVKVLLRAHGEPPQTYTTAAKNNVEIIDATCPVVLQLQRRIKKRMTRVLKPKRTEERNLLL